MQSLTLSSGESMLLQWVRQHLTLFTKHTQIVHGIMKILRLWELLCHLHIYQTIALGMIKERLKELDV